MLMDVRKVELTAHRCIVSATDASPFYLRYIVLSVFFFVTDLKSQILLLKAGEYVTFLMSISIF